MVRKPAGIPVTNGLSRISCSRDLLLVLLIPRGGIAASTGTVQTLDESPPEFTTLAIKAGESRTETRWNLTGPSRSYKW